jgi:hypothetical protein
VTTTGTHSGRRDDKTTAGRSHEIGLSPDTATVERVGTFVIYTWEVSIAGHDVNQWTTDPILGNVVSGGVRLHRFAPVFVTDSYPRSWNQWTVAVNNQSFDTEKLTIYAILDFEDDAAAKKAAPAGERPVAEALSADLLAAVSAGEPAHRPTHHVGSTLAKQAREDVTLHIKDATVTTAGSVNIYQWDHVVKSGEKVAWTTEALPDPVVSGGLHVHDWYFVVLTDTFPASANQWRIGVESFDGEATVTVYAVTMSGALVTDYQWNARIDGHKSTTWTTPSLPGVIVGGGIHVHGWYDVRLTNNYPASTSQWAVGSESFESSPVDVTIFGIAVTP